MPLAQVRAVVSPPLVIKDEAENPKFKEMANELSFLKDSLDNQQATIEKLRAE